VELPLTFINATIQVCVLYWTVGFDGNFIDWVALVFATAVATSSVGWLISSLTSSPLTALRLIPIVLLPQLLFSGLLTDVDLIPSWLNWMEYLCYLKYCINIAFLVEMQQYLSMNPVPEAVQSLADQNSIDREQITLYVGIVIVIIVLCRLVAALALYRYRTTQYLKL
jgi:ABC-type multidrug transport system permease subunit